MTTIQIPSTTGGVLKIGDDVDHLHLLGGSQDLLQLFHDHAAVIGGNLDKGGLSSLKCVHGAQVRGALQQHHITGVQEHAGGEIQTLLRTGGHENVIGIGLDIVLSQHTISNLLTQAGETLSGRILQSSTATFLQNSHRGFHNLLDREQLGGWHTAGERHDLGTACQLQQLTDSRALQQVHSTCKLYHKPFSS